MKPATPLQSIVDPFVRGVGGELVSDLIGQSNLPANADYLFRRHNIIAELKGLEAQSFGEAFLRKMGDLATRWQNAGQIMVYGSGRIDSSGLRPECREEMFNLMTGPLQKNVVAAANRQIGETKKLLGLPGAKGLLWVASDGNQDLRPNIVWYLLRRILAKKHSDGSPQYSHIDGVAYFSPRMLAEAPGVPYPVVFWLSGAREKDHREMLDLQSLLQGAWPTYVSRISGVPVHAVSGMTVVPERLRFRGIADAMPRVVIGKRRNG